MTGVFTPELRFTWVKGQVTSGTPDEGFVACGDGTAYPMEATLDQIAEIFYRAKNAYFIAGQVNFDYYAAARYLNASTTAPLNFAGSVDNIDGTALHIRGYTTIDNGTISDHNLAYLGESYQEIESVFSPTIVDYRDIADNERGIWISGIGVTKPQWDAVNAFTFYTEYAASTPYTPVPDVTRYFSINDGFSYLYTWGAVSFNGKIAYVDGGGGMYDPATRFFIGLSLDVSTSEDSARLIYGSTDEASLVDVATFYDYGTLCDYIIRLSSGDISCPIYFGTCSNDDPATVENVTASDFIHEATEWWPYAKDSPAVPVWNVATGAKL